MAKPSPAVGKSILVVEDEVIIGMMMCRELERAGALPIGPLTSVADAVKEIDSRIVDLVILDAKLARWLGRRPGCLSPRSADPLRGGQRLRKSESAGWAERRSLRCQARIDAAPDGSDRICVDRFCCRGLACVKKDAHQRFCD